VIFVFFVVKFFFLDLYSLSSGQESPMRKQAEMKQVDVETTYSLSRIPARGDHSSFSQCQELLQRLAGLDELWAAYGVRRVWVFGSLLAPERFGPGSDVDILVEGAGPQVFQLAAEVERRLRWPVDLLDVELASARLLERVRARGRIIYAA
jgi:predicted nucleotidyltransferase